MDNEGHKSQQDVVGEVKKHPWEEKPEVVVPTSESERVEHAKINDLEKKKARRQKRQARKAKFFGFVKGHKILSALIGVAIIAAIAGVIVGVVLLNQPKKVEEKPCEDYDECNIGFDFPEGTTIRSQRDPRQAYKVANSRFIKEIKTDIYLDGAIDYGKLADKYNNLKKTLEDEYEKVCYDLFYAAELAVMGNTIYADEILKEYDAKAHKLEGNQYYFYIVARMTYYRLKGDTEEFEKYKEIFEKDYNDEELDKKFMDVK